MSGDYLWDRSGRDAEIEKLEGMLAPFAHTRRRRRRWWAPLAGATLLAVAIAGLLSEERPAWDVEWLEGGGSAQLAVGDWLRTDKGSRARITVADIGHVQVEPESRVRLVRTSKREHRLELERGRLEALVYAPPRLFVVDTPTAEAVDLGCAYSLEVDGEGEGLLSVFSGYVELAMKGGLTVVVPGGASCRLRGVPYYDDAPEALREPERDLAAVLGAARPRDTLTLFHLFPRVGAEKRALLFEKMASFAPPPEGVTRDRIVRLDRAALDAWRRKLDW